MSQKLFRSTAVFSAMTLISRVFGYARDMVIAIHFGADGATDAFFVAFRIPNFLRRLFAEGAFSQAFIPVFTEHKERQDMEALRELLSRTAGTLFGILALVTIVGVLGAPLLILIFAPGFADDPSRFALATDMLRLTFPYLLFISLTALAGGALNSFGRFAVPAFTPVFLNLSLIGVTLWLAPHLQQPIIALAIGVLIAGILQLGFQLPFMHRLGLLPLPRWGHAHAGVRRIMKLMVPALFGSSVVQINFLFDSLVASFLAAGSISWLYFSERFMEMPLALFGVALGTVILPKLSQHHARRAQADFSATLDWAMRAATLIAVPAMLGLTLLAGPILTALIEYRAFNAFDVRMTALSLIGFAAGLPAYMVLKILAPGFYARQDTHTPVKVGVIALLFNMALTVALVTPWYLLGIPGPHTGLAISTSLAAYLNAGLLYRKLRREGIYTDPKWHGVLWRALLAGAGMCALLLALSPPLAQWSAWGLASRLWHLAGLILLGGGAYAGILLLLGVRLRDFIHA